jgi:hypothetical protein
VSGCVFTVSTEISESTYFLHLHILWGTTTTSWSLVRIAFLENLLLVTFVVTPERQASGRVASCQNRQGKQVEKQVEKQVG